MPLTLKNLAILMPFGAAVMWGAYYALAEHNLTKLSVSSWMVVNCLTQMIVGIVLSRVTGEGLHYGPVLADGKSFALFLLCIASACFATFMLMFAIQQTSATYAALGEVAYPLFVPLFAWLLFGHRDVTLSTALGGVLVLGGACVLVFGKIKGW